MYIRIALQLSSVGKPLSRLPQRSNPKPRLSLLKRRNPSQRLSCCSLEWHSRTFKTFGHSMTEGQTRPLEFRPKLSIREAESLYNAMSTPLNLVDVYRTAISEALAPITSVPASDILPKLQWTQTQDKGDLMLPVPALRVKGKKPTEQAVEFAEKVRIIPFYIGRKHAYNQLLYSFQSQKLSRSLQSTVPLYSSVSNPHRLPNSYFLQYSKRKPRMGGILVTVSGIPLIPRRAESVS